MIAKGCDECRHTGFRGREGIYEILKVNETLSTLIRPHANSAELRRVALEQGMRPLKISGANKIAAGKTTLEEVISVVPPTAG